MHVRPLYRDRDLADVLDLVGTSRQAFRRLGVARAIVHEVFCRASAVRAAYVMVWGGTSNAEAKAPYESAGMRSRRVLRDWRLTL